MKKSLLLLSVMAAFSLGVSAGNIGNTILTTDLKYRVTSSNTVEVLGEVNSKTTSYTIPSTLIKISHTGTLYDASV